MRDDLYCKVYVNGVADGAALKTVITAATGAPFTGRTARTAGLCIDVFDIGRHTAVADDPNDFVRWPVYLEIEPLDEAMLKPAFIAALGGFLKTLNDRGLPTVTASDIDDELTEAQRRPN